jgi:hypothetical protein
MPSDSIRVDAGSREENASRQKSVIHQSGSEAGRRFEDRFRRLLMVQTEKIGDNPAHSQPAPG